MKFHKHIRKTIWFFLPLSFLLNSCSMIKWTVPPEIVGKWESDKSKVTVRTEPRWMRFEFTSDSATATITINEDKTASGYIGSTKFKNGRIRKNSGDPERTGVTYIIKCYWIGKIFPNDPVDSKEVELWLGPLKEGKINAELRFTEGMAVFPMGDFKFRKAKE